MSKAIQIRYLIEGATPSHPKAHSADLVPVFEDFVQNVRITKTWTVMSPGVRLYFPVAEYKGRVYPIKFEPENAIKGEPPEMSLTIVAEGGTNDRPS